MTDVLLVAHHDRMEAAALARQAASWLVEHGHSAWMTPEDAEPLELLDLVSERKPESAGLALSLGGDGTMLRAVKMLGGLACRSSVSTSGCSAISPRSNRRR